MRLKLTLFLVLLNVALFCYIFYLETGQGQSASEARGRLILPAGTISQVEEIELSGPRVASPWILRNEGRNWTVNQPVEWPANPYAVRRLLDLLTFLQWETRFPVESVREAGKDLADYGLDENAAELRLTGANGIVSLRVGQPTEIGNRVYVLSPDQSEVFVVDRSLLKGVNLDTESLIDNAVVEIPTFEAESLNLSIGASSTVRVQLSRRNRDWVFNAPIRSPADSRKVHAALDALHDLEVTRFTDLTPAAAGIADPSLRINLNGNDRQQTLLIGDIVNPDAVPLERYVKLEARPVIFRVPAEPFEVWFKAQESLRERRFIKFPPDEAGTLEVRFNDRSISLQRLESGQWQLVQTTDGNLTTLAADDALIQRLLERLSSLEALRFVTDAPSSADLERFGFNDPQRVITVRLQNGARHNLLLGNLVPRDADEGQSNRLYAKLEGGSSIFLTTASILADLPLNGLHYRKRVAGSLPAGASIEAVRIVDLAADEPSLEVRRQPGKDWEQAVNELSAPEEAAAAIALVEAFRKFPVDTFLADSFSDPLRLDAERSIPWEFAIEADVRLPGSENAQVETRRYFLTRRLGGSTQYAGSRALDLTFRLTQSLIDALHPLLFHRPRPDENVRAGAEDEDRTESEGVAESMDVPHGEDATSPVPSGETPDSASESQPSPQHETEADGLPEANDELVPAPGPPDAEPQPDGPTATPATESDS